MTTENQISEESPPLLVAEETSKGKAVAEAAEAAENDEMILSSYRVYCASRSTGVGEGLQMQRFIFPTAMPRRFFDLDLFIPDPTTNDIRATAKSRTRGFKQEYHNIVQKLVTDHTGGMFMSRPWPCVVCGGAAVKPLHGMIPHFEVQRDAIDGEEEEGRGYYGASVAIPLTEGRIYRIGWVGDKGKNKGRRYVNKLAMAPIGTVHGEELDKLKPCVLDVATPVCTVHHECEIMAGELQRSLVRGIISGMYKVDPEDMPWWADENMLNSADFMDEEPKVVQCVVCGSVVGDDIMKCGGCEYVGYCSKSCQLDHWPTHKYNCDELRDRAHAAILIDFSRSAIEEEDEDSAAQETTAGGSGVQAAPSKPKKKNKGRNRGKGKRKDKGKSVEVKDGKQVGDEEENATGAKDAGVEARPNDGDGKNVEDASENQDADKDGKN